MSARLLAGRGRFLDDLTAGAYAVAFVRSPHARARVADVDAAGALDVPGLLAVYTWEDLAAADARSGSGVSQPLPTPHQYPNGRMPTALAHGKVRHAGEAVAMVVAADRYAAEDAAAAVRVTYDRLRPVVGLDHAREALRLVHEDVPGNVAARHVVDSGDARAAIEAAPHVLELRLDIARSAALPLEGRGVLARWDAAEESLRVWSSSRAVAGVRDAVATALGLPLRRVDAIAGDVGGSFGIKRLHPWPEEILVAWAARELGHAVAWTQDQTERLGQAGAERGQVQQVRAGFDDDGRLLGLDVVLWHDTGAYTPAGLDLPMATAAHMAGPYGLDACRVEIVVLYTNTPAVLPYRGAGAAHAAFAVERTLDAIAAQTGLDRCAIRAANLLAPEDLPHPRAVRLADGRPLVHDAGRYHACLERVQEMIGWAAFAAEQEKAAAAGRRLGIGVGCFVSAPAAAAYASARVEVSPTGRVEVQTGESPAGGHTALVRIAAGALGVAEADVDLAGADTRRFAGPTGGHPASLAMAGGAVGAAAAAAREKALRIAGEALEADPGDLEIVGGRVRVVGMAGGPGLTLAEVAVLSDPARSGGPARLADGEPPGISATAYFAPEAVGVSMGAHAAVVETDPDTAEVRLLRYAAVHDCGTLLDPATAQQQVRGAVALGIGAALHERVGYDEEGLPLAATLADVGMPSAAEIPVVQVDHVQTPSPTSPLGAKPGGELGAIGVGAVVAAAIEDAEGLPIRSMPVSPSDLLALRADLAAGRLSALHRGGAGGSVAPPPEEAS